MTPHILHYTDNLPEGVGGTAQGPIIRIRPKYKDDKGLHQHELEHVKQWWIATIVSAVLLAAGLYHFQEPLWGAVGSIGVHGALYKLISAYRLWCEVQAHKVQLQYSPHALKHFAKRIAEKYDLNITAEEAEQRLREA
jgi:hypothetical protein